MSGVPSSGGTGGDLSLGPAIEQLRKNNNLTNVVHDASEDETRIVGIPGQTVQRQVVVMPSSFSWSKLAGISFVAVIAIGAVVMVVVSYLNTVTFFGK